MLRCAVSAAISLDDTRLWPNLGEQFAEFSRDRIVTREAMGASVIARTLDRGNGMERTGAVDTDQRLFGGIVSGESMDWGITGHILPRDAAMQSDDISRGMQVLHLSTGHILNTSV